MKPDLFDHLDMQRIVRRSRKGVLGDTSLRPTPAGIAVLLCVRGGFELAGVDAHMLCCTLADEPDGMPNRSFSLALGGKLYNAAGEVVSRQDMTDMLLRGAPARQMAGEIKPRRARVAWHDSNASQARAKKAAVGIPVSFEMQARISLIVQDELTRAQARYLEETTPASPSLARGRL